MSSSEDDYTSDGSATVERSPTSPPASIGRDFNINIPNQISRSKGQERRHLSCPSTPVGRKGRSFDIEKHRGRLFEMVDSGQSNNCDEESQANLEKVLQYFRDEMEKVQEFSRDLFEKNQALQQKIDHEEEVMKGKEKEWTFEREKLELEIHDLRSQSVNTTVHLEQLKDENNQMRLSMEQTRRNFERVLKKNKQLREKLLRVATRKSTMQKELGSLDKVKDRLVRETKNLRRKLSKNVIVKKHQVKEKSLLLQELHHARKRERRLRAEKRILQKKASESDVTDLLSGTIRRAKSKKHIDARRRSIKMVKSSGNLKKYIILKQQIKTTFEHEKANLMWTRLCKGEIQRMKVQLCRIRSDVTSLVDGAMEQCSKLIPAIVEIHKWVGNSVSRNSLEYADMQFTALQDLGLLSFYEKSKLTPKKDGYLELSTFMRWRKVYVVISAAPLEIVVWESAEMREERFRHFLSEEKEQEEEEEQEEEDNSENLVGNSDEMGMIPELLGMGMEKDKLEKLLSKDEIIAQLQTPGKEKEKKSRVVKKRRVRRQVKIMARVEKVKREKFVLWVNSKKIVFRALDEKKRDEWYGFLKNLLQEKK